MYRAVFEQQNRVRMLNFRTASFQLFKKFVDGTAWETVLGDKGPEQSWQLFKDTFLRAPELLIHMCKKLGKEGRQDTSMAE